MERKSAHTSLASLFIVTATFAVALAFWVNDSDGDWNIIVTAASASLIAALLTRFGITGGLLVGVLAVFIACLVVEKDPSGLGPFEIIFPIQLVVGLVPMIATAAIGRSLREWLLRSTR